MSDISIDGWGIEYVKTFHDTAIKLGVRKIEAGTWHWYVHDLESEGDSALLAVSNIPGSATPEEAAANALEYYEHCWLPYFLTTGDREGPLD